MTDIQNFIGRSSTEADRKREYRQRIAEEKKAESSIVNVGDIPSITEKQKKTSIAPIKAGYSTAFEELWSKYPRKKEKSGAYDKYKARISDGYSHEELLQATEAYAAECKKNRTEERFIKQGKTFFGPSTPFLDYLKKNEAREDTDTTEDTGNPFRR